MDSISHEQRSWNMSRIRGKNTKPEIVVRRLLHNLGYRFRLHKQGLPGTPDLVLKSYKTVVFVQGCFWHRHQGCKLSNLPKSRRTYWQNKFRKNVARDKRNQMLLTKAGWNVIVVWECEAQQPNQLSRALDRAIRGDSVPRRAENCD